MLQNRPNISAGFSYKNRMEQNLTVFEFPLTERVRTWLRLEDLFDKAEFFARSTDARCHHAGLLAIFE